MRNLYYYGFVAHFGEGATKWLADARKSAEEIIFAGRKNENLIPIPVNSELFMSFAGRTDTLFDSFPLMNIIKEVRQSKVLPVEDLELLKKLELRVEAHERLHGGGQLSASKHIFLVF